MKLELSSRQGLLRLSATILASGMAFLDSTAVNVALPAIARELGVTPSFFGFRAHSGLRAFYSW